MAWILILFLFWQSPAVAQTTQRKKAPVVGQVPGPAKKSAPAKQVAPTDTRWTLESLSVEGNSTYSRKQIVAATGLRIGQLAGKREFDAARDRLMATGVFESVAYRFGPAANGKGYAATFQVLEVAQVYPIRFDRLDAPPDQLTQVLKKSDPFFGDNIPATDVVLKRYAKVIEDYLASQGKKETVIGRLTVDEPNRIVILFRPEAAPPAVAEVTFTGNTVLPLTALQNAIAGVAVGAPFSESRFRQILDTTIRPMYEERGRIRVAFPSVRTAKARQVNGLAVTVEVVEGESYKLGEVGFAAAGLPEKDLRKAVGLKSGEIANFTEVKAGLDRIRKFLGRNGYMSPELRTDRTIHDDAKTVDVIIHVEQGQRFTFGKLTIKGLDIHGEAAIKQLWALKPGAPYNIEYPDYFLARIVEDNVFDNLKKTKALPDINETAHTVDVTLVFN